MLIQFWFFGDVCPYLQEQNYEGSKPVLAILETQFFCHFAPTGGHVMKLLDVTKLVGAQLGKSLLSDQMKALFNLFLPALNLRMFGDIRFEAMAAICDCELTNIRKGALTTRMAEQKDTKSLGL